MSEENLTEDNLIERKSKPRKYFIDFENVHGAGLKGVDALGASDEVVIIYSQAAETFHIEHAIDIMKSKARVEFVEVDGGTRNAADFQLIVALFGAMDEAFDYVIVSGDGGFDAAIKMGERLGLPHVSRAVNIRGDLEAEKPDKPKTRRGGRRSRRGGGNGDEARDAANGEEKGPGDDGGAGNESPGGDAKEAAQPASGASAKGDGSTGANGTADTEAKAKAEASPNGSDGTARPAALADENGDQPGAPDGAHSDQPSKSSRRRSRRRRSQASAGEAAQRQEADTAAGEAPAADASDGAPVIAAADAEPAAAADAPAAPDAPASTPDAPAESAAPAPVDEPVDTPDAQSPTKREQVVAALEKKEIRLEDELLDVLMAALDGAEGRQDFYRRIIQALKQKRGLPLYRLVRDSYASLAEIAARA